MEECLELLTKVRGYSDEQILAKGQCAGGPPTSELAKRHPNINVWIDQSPAGYNQMIDSLYKPYLDEGISELEGSSSWKNTLIQGIGRVLRQSQVVPKILSSIVPSFHVPTNLEKNKGKQLFTIGVPDENGKGGDKLVPESQRDEIICSVAHNGGKFIPMVGAEHITNWWQVPDVKIGVRKFLADTEIASSLITPSDLGRTLASKLTGYLYGVSYSSQDATVEQKKVVSFLHMTFLIFDDEIQVRENIDLLCAEMGEKARGPLTKAALEIAKDANKIDLAIHLERDLRKCGPGTPKKLVT